MGVKSFLSRISVKKSAVMQANQAINIFFDFACMFLFFFNFVTLKQ